MPEKTVSIRSRCLDGTPSDVKEAAKRPKGPEEKREDDEKNKEGLGPNLALVVHSWIP